MTKITRRQFHMGTGLTLTALAALSPPKAHATVPDGMPLIREKTLSRIVYGSCCHQDKPQPIWDAILKRQPELFIFLGDNIYGDTRDMAVLKAKYDKQAVNYARIRQESDVIAIWDDHDFGENDAGKTYPFRDQSKALFFDFWNEPKDSPRRRDNDGIYSSYLYGPADKRVHIILPDLRYNRDDLETVASRRITRERDLAGLGPYLPIADKSTTMLGEAQWQWLEQQMQIPSRIKIIGSSLQYIASQPGWEAWSNFPHERQRLIDLIGKYKVDGLFFISGDTHWAELSCQTEGTPYPLWDMTSSGLTQTWDNVSPNAYRWQDLSYSGQNFGTIYIDWLLKDPLIVFEARDNRGNRIFQHTIVLSSLKGPW
ncbi:Phosphodiesterase/alkaline phosphatase D-like protein [hydrothermal vent metagenome]|uniref:Phosphodiesterase/alkaline phosphatase D-like protein n=1 Tax=hydrothermal vent metagenome TaxID=652676 RepID=A0A3B0RV19_9ZZZZ